MAKAAKKKKLTKDELLEEAAEILAKIEKAEISCQMARIEVEIQKESYKTAKASYGERVDELRALCRVRKEKHPLFTQPTTPAAGDSGKQSEAPSTTDQPTEADAQADGAESKPEVAADAKAWRRWPTSCLVEHGFPKGKLKLIEEAGFSTMGKLIDRMNRAGSEDHWWKDLKGFGESGYDTLVDAMMALRNAKPEFQEA